MVIYTGQYKEDNSPAASAKESNPPPSDHESGALRINMNMRGALPININMSVDSCIGTYTRTPFFSLSYRGI